MADDANMRAWIMARAGAWRGLVASIAELRRQRHATVDQALAAERRLVTSLIVLHELRLGCGLHHDPAGELQRVEGILTFVEIQPFNNDDMYIAAAIRARMCRQGRAIGGIDSLIAGQVLARGWTVVTANSREFTHIEGLNVIDWTLAAD